MNSGGGRWPELNWSQYAQVGLSAIAVVIAGYLFWLVINWQKDNQDLFCSSKAENDSCAKLLWCHFWALVAALSLLVLAWYCIWHI
jgi:hypothetical protein